MDADRWQRRAPWVAAVAAVATVLLVLLPAGTGRISGPVPPTPVGPAPQAVRTVLESMTTPRTAEDIRSSAERMADALVDVCGSRRCLQGSSPLLGDRVAEPPGVDGVRVE